MAGFQNRKYVFHETVTQSYLIIKAIIETILINKSQLIKRLSHFLVFSAMSVCHSSCHVSLTSIKLLPAFSYHSQITLVCYYVS